MSAKTDFLAAHNACVANNPSTEVDDDGNPIPSDARKACEKAAKDAYEAARAVEQANG